MTQLTVRGRKQRTVGALIDLGTEITILSNAYARVLGLHCSAETELEFAGETRAVCYRNVDLRIPTLIGSLKR